MKVAYLDCFSGISGDMTLGAVMAAGVPLETLAAELAKLNLTGYELTATPVMKKGITAIKAEIVVTEKQVFRHLPQIEKIINSSTLSDKIKADSLKVFKRLGEAEAKVHGIPLEKVHFHEVGAMDSIMDIVGGVIGLHLLGIEKLYCSPLNTGSGTVQTEHGLLPVPAPATVELCKNTPLYSNGVEKELVTPTGAALVTTLAESFGPLPPMTITTVGYGAGGADLPTQANVLRLIIGEEAAGKKTDTVTLLETNLDDVNPQTYDLVMERLFDAGALDVFLTPIQMKKNRPGILLSVLCNPGDTKTLESIMFRETGTFGIRSTTLTRTILNREFKTVTTSYGDIRIKIGSRGNEVIVTSPEYEDCKLAALENGVSLDQVRQAALQAYRRWVDGNTKGCGC